MVSVKSRAHRILKHLGAYSSSAKDLEKFAGRILPEVNRELLGVYFNPPSATVEAIVVSDAGLHLIEKEEVTTIPFVAIRKIKGPPEKMEASVLNIQLKDGRSQEVPILAGNERFKDVFEFMRFLARVVADQNETDDVSISDP